MALIKCPECGREISDKAVSCPNCGCPINIQEIKNTNDIPQCPNLDKVKNRFNKKIILIIIIVLVILVCGILFYNFYFIKPQIIEKQNNNTYEKAIDFLESGKYEEGEELLQTIVGYEDVDIILEQIKWESFAYEAINCVKEYLKNPDSFQLYEIIFYSPKDENGETITDTNLMRPIILMHYGAQNGFGGNTTGYAICNYEWINEAYTFVGSCKSLNEEDYSQNDKNDADDLIVCKVINIFRNDYDTIGNVDLARMKTVLKNDAYTINKIIE